MRLPSLSQLRFLCVDTERSSGEELAGGFQRIPNRRSLPDYFEVISVPVAFSTIRVGLLIQHVALRELLIDQ